MAIGTSGARLQVDGTAAIGTVHLLHRFAQMPNFRRRKRANKILFFQEIKEADVVAVLAGALPVNKVYIAGHIVRQGKAGAAVRAHEPVGQGGFGDSGVVANILHQLQRRSRSQPKVFVALKPEGLAAGANIHGDLQVEVTRELPIRHGRAAVGAVHMVDWCFNEYSRANAHLSAFRAARCSVAK